MTMGMLRFNQHVRSINPGESERYGYQASIITMRTLAEVPFTQQNLWDLENRWKEEREDNESDRISFSVSHVVGNVEIVILPPWLKHHEKFGQSH